MVDVYQMVTDRILEELEKGCIPWHRPWRSVRAYNRVSGKNYSLLNQLLLKHTGEYASYNQWAKLGAHIRKGEKSEFVVFWKWQEEDSSKPKEGETKSAESGENKKGHPILKYYRVFHISQVDGVDPLKPEQELLFDTNPIEEAEKLFADYVKREGIKVDTMMSEQAYYSPASDGIHLPCIKQFECAEEYYSTAFHEVVHSTGHPMRLNRGLKTAAFGSQSYSKEELVAEIGSCYILNLLGIETEPCFKNSAAYIQGWLSALKSDRRMLVSAASQSEKAVNFIMGKNPDA